MEERIGVKDRSDSWDILMGDARSATLHILQDLIIVAMKEGKFDDDLAEYLTCSVESLRLEAKERHAFIRERREDK